MNNNRPVFLNLAQMKMPITAVVSFLHRVSGLLLFLFLPLLMWLLGQSLFSAARFHAIQVMSHVMYFRLATWVLLGALAHHFFAGVRHMIMDFGVGESLRSAQLSAYLVLALDLLWLIAMGVWLW